MNTPVAPFSHLSTLWIQVTGTWCNLRCVHCLNANGPKDPWLKSLDTETVERAIKEADGLGIKEVYFTGGEPFLHRDILELLAFSLQVAPTTVLTNGTLITENVADALATLARAASYSLEIRVSIDDIEAAKNDRIRGRGALAKAVRAMQLLRLADGKHLVNVGVIGRLENDGRTNVWYTILTAGDELQVEFVPVDYDYGTLARQMAQEGLPQEFIETIHTGRWTTCLEILPAKERARGRY